eukprot:1161373-Pelagomonas_calceolata.AAC.11
MFTQLACSCCASSHYILQICDRDGNTCYVGAEKLICKSFSAWRKARSSWCTAGSHVWYFWNECTFGSGQAQKEGTCRPTQDAAAKCSYLASHLPNWLQLLTKMPIVWKVGVIIFIPAAE